MCWHCKTICGFSIENSSRHVGQQWSSSCSAGLPSDTVRAPYDLGRLQWRRHETSQGL